MKKYENHELWFECEIDATLDDVWQQWTTENGLASFFAPVVRFDLKVDGPFEMLFNPDQPEGQRGAEGMRILAIEEKKLLSFTWSAPPKYPDIRKQRTFVIVTFEKVDEKKTKVWLRNLGYGFSKQWMDALEYFRVAWGKVVLPRLKYSLEVGPIDWAHPPKLSG